MKTSIFQILISAESASIHPAISGFKLLVFIIHFIGFSTFTANNNSHEEQITKRILSVKLAVSLFKQLAQLYHYSIFSMVSLLTHGYCIMSCILLLQVILCLFNITICNFIMGFNYYLPVLIFCIFSFLTSY